MGGGGKGGGGGGGSTTTVQKADPWEGQQPYLKDIFEQAKNMYEGGQMAPDYFPGQTVAGMSDWTKQALQMQADRAMNGSQLINDASNAMGNVMTGQALQGNQGMNTLNNMKYADDSSQQLKDLAGGYNNAAAGQLGDHAGNYNNAGAGILEQMAQEDNPYTDALYNRANSQAQAGISASFNQAGRYGSGAHAAAAADAANNLANDMYSSLYDKRVNAATNAGNLYNQGFNAQTGALGTAGQLYNQGMSTQAGMIGSAGQLYNQGFNSQAGAAQSAGQLYNQGIGQQIMGAGQAQQLGNQAYTDSAALSEAGGVMDDYNQQLINADIDRWNYDQNKALQALSNYNQLIQGNYGGTSTSTGQVQNYGGNTLGNVAGGALAGGGLGYMLGGAASPWIAGGAALGGLLGLF